MLFLKGQACRTANQPNKAIQYLSQSSKLDPDNSHTYLALAWCYKRTGQLGLAIEVMKSAVELDSDSAIAHYNLACYWALSQQVKLAVLYLSNAFDLNPDYRDYVDKESDFDAIREDPDFVASLDVIV